MPVGDLVELFNRRSGDYSLAGVDESVIRSHQQVADTFRQLGVLDGAADVRPLWDRRFDALLRAPSAA